MNNIKAIFLDIDGTMTNHLEVISSSLINVLKELKNKDIRIIITTGRNLLYTKIFLNKIGIKDIVISNNGATIYDLENDKLILNKSLENKDVLKIYDYCSKHDCQLTLHTLDNNIDVLNKKDIVENVTSVTITSNNYERMQIMESLFLDKIPNVKIVNSSKALVEKHFKKGDIYFHDVASFNVSKGNAILEVQDYLNIDSSKCLCVGDSDNDISMTYVCDYSYAMGNATNDLKELASGVLESIDKDGLYLFLKDYVDNYTSLN